MTDEVPSALLTDSTEDLVLDLLDLLRVHDVLPLLRPDQAAILIAVYWHDEPVGTNNTRKSQIRRARMAFRERWETAA